jgi:hypothetical protein
MDNEDDRKAYMKLSQDKGKSKEETLKDMNDAIIIYKVHRLDELPERRVFKVATGKLPKEQAEEYIQKLMKDYREKKTFYPAVNMLEDRNDFDYQQEKDFDYQNKSLWKRFTDWLSSSIFAGWHT